MNCKQVTLEFSGVPVLTPSVDFNVFFIRNVSNRFPLWDELLKPIAEELYPGYHEAIDLHIEKVVPYLRRRDGGVSESYKKS